MDANVAFYETERQRRDRIATAAMVGLLTMPEPDGGTANRSPGYVAACAVEYADALIARLDGPPRPAPASPHGTCDGCGRFTENCVCFRVEDHVLGDDE